MRVTDLGDPRDRRQVHVWGWVPSSHPWAAAGGPNTGSAVPPRPQTEACKQCPEAETREAHKIAGEFALERRVAPTQAPLQEGLTQARVSLLGHGVIEH
ncbi:hypothetical protein NDU88_003555 [Pleurodeles waltl]|uniref:Uncharacterized protein n=1 Tax=Pleurodeles waltl TaxID=8319 RepID=A0AAV7WVM7_PLEWA|nr:hypothetical protein NDU88_003555 [Pleurodeles waltl]